MKDVKEKCFLFVSVFVFPLKEEKITFEDVKKIRSLIREILFIYIQEATKVILSDIFFNISLQFSVTMLSNIQVTNYLLFYLEKFLMEGKKKHITVPNSHMINSREKKTVKQPFYSNYWLNIVQMKYTN